jgi:hypothetical protein
MKERIDRLYSYISCQDSFELMDVGKQLRTLIEDLEKRVEYLETTKSVDKPTVPTVPMAMLMRCYQEKHTDYPTLNGVKEHTDYPTLNGVKVLCAIIAAEFGYEVTE